MTLNNRPFSIGFKIIFSLAFITILGPAALDMYLPAMPQMTKELKTDYASMQLTLSVFLLALGLGQLLFGPVIDAYGRRRPLLIAALLFFGSSLLASSANNIEVMLFARFFQGLAASLLIVIAMSSVRDLASGSLATQLFALLVTIQGAAPIFAPAIGGVINVYHGWRAVMLVLAVLGFIAFLISLLNLPETLPKQQRIPLRLGGIFQQYRRLLSDIQFMIPTLALAVVFMFLFSYIGGASYIYQVALGLSPDVFGFVFGGTGIAMMLGAMLSGFLAKYWHNEYLAISAIAIISIGVLLALTGYAYGWGLVGIVAGLAVAVFGMGAAEPAIMALAMNSQSHAIGLAAALLGAGSYIFGALATPVAGAAAETGIASWLGLLFLISFLALMLMLISLVTHNGQQENA